MTNQPRAILPLLRARVIDIDRATGSFKLAIGGSTTITISLPATLDAYDIRDGDLLTLYTEVLLTQPKGTS
jgi:hypothetical protein